MKWERSTRGRTRGTSSRRTAGPLRRGPRAPRPRPHARLARAAPRLAHAGALPGRGASRPRPARRDPGRPLRGPRRRVGRRQRGDRRRREPPRHVLPARVGAGYVAEAFRRPTPPTPARGSTTTTSTPRESGARRTASTASSAASSTPASRSTASGSRCTSGRPARPGPRDPRQRRAAPPPRPRGPHLRDGRPRPRRSPGRSPRPPAPRVPGRDRRVRRPPRLRRRDVLGHVRPALVDPQALRRGRAAPLRPRLRAETRLLRRPRSARREPRRSRPSRGRASSPRTSRTRSRSPRPRSGQLPEPAPGIERDVAARRVDVVGLQALAEPAAQLRALEEPARPRSASRATAHGVTTSSFDAVAPDLGVARERVRLRRARDRHGGEVRVGRRELERHGAEGLPVAELERGDEGDRVRVPVDEPPVDRLLGSAAPVRPGVEVVLRVRVEQAEGRAAGSARAGATCAGPRRAPSEYVL